MGNEGATESKNSRNEIDKVIMVGWSIVVASACMYGDWGKDAMIEFRIHFIK